MSANIWNPGSTIPVTANADRTYLSQRFVATAGQTLFTLTQFAYQTGSGSIDVFINGVLQSLTVDFTETSSVSITMLTALRAGDVVVLRGLVGGTAAVAATVSANAAAASAVTAANQVVLAANQVTLATAQVTAATTVYNNCVAVYNSIVNLSLPNLPLLPVYGGTGLDGHVAANGKLLIGNGAGYSLANLTAGNNVTIANGAGAITISAGNSSLVLAPLAAAALPVDAMSMILTNVSYTLPDLTTTTSSFGLMALSNAATVPTTVTTSDGWSVATSFVAGTYAAIAPYSKATPHGTWGGQTMTAPLLATLAGTAVPTYQGTVSMPNGIIVLFFTTTAGLYGACIDTVNNVIGAAVQLNATTSTATIASSFTAYADSATAIVFGCYQGVNVFKIQALSIAGTVITAGAAVTMGSSSTYMNMIQLAAGLYIAGTNTSIIAATVAGTVCTVGAAVASGVTGALTGIARLTNTTALVVGYLTGAAPQSGVGQVTTITGTVPSYGAAVNTATAIQATSAAFTGLVAFDATNFLAYFRNNTTNTNTNFYAVSVAGTVVTWGAVNTQTITNQVSAYTPSTWVTGTGPGVAIANYDATHIMFGDQTTGPLVVSLAAGVLTFGVAQFAAQTNGLFYRDFANTSWFYVGTTAFDRFTAIAGTTITSLEQVTAVPTAFLSATINNKAVKYTATWYTWTVLWNRAVSATQTIRISGNNTLLYGPIS